MKTLRTANKRRIPRSIKWALICILGFALIESVSLDVVTRTLTEIFGVVQKSFSLHEIPKDGISVDVDLFGNILVIDYARKEARIYRAW